MIASWHLRSEVLTPEDGKGLALALKGDGRFTRTSSDAVRSEGGNLAASDADVWLLRLGLEGSRRFALGRAGEGASVTPSFELGFWRLMRSTRTLPATSRISLRPGPASTGCCWRVSPANTTLAPWRSESCRM